MPRSSPTGRATPSAHLTAARHACPPGTTHEKYGAAKLSEAGTAQDFVTRTIKKVLDEETTRLENGLTTLATIGATAPFVGLFGTVWGVYHALVADRHERCRHARQGGRPRRRGADHDRHRSRGRDPRGGRPTTPSSAATACSMRRLDAFAFELLTFLSMGQSLKPGLDGEASHGWSAAASAPAPDRGRRNRRGGCAVAAPGSGLICPRPHPGHRGNGPWPLPVSIARPPVHRLSGNQHGAADRRDARAARHLHRHRAAAHARRQARAAASARSQVNQAEPDRIEFAIDAAGPAATGTASGSVAPKTPHARFISWPAPGRRSRRSTCAPMGRWPTTMWPRPWPMPRPPG
jgi:hypothetical protein